jgi:hypothetical protein
LSHEASWVLMAQRCSMVAFLRPQLATITASRIRLLSRTPQAVKV